MRPGCEATMIRTQVRFRTELFRPPQSEDDQFKNGEELAKWLERNIPTHGLNVSDCFPEDWGWRVEFMGISGVWVGCGFVEKDQWSFFCEYTRSFKDKLLRRPLPEGEMKKVISAVATLVGSERKIFEV